MSKDPRFNFYPDNWIGGTYGFTLEQKGAYFELLLLNFYVGPFTHDQAIRKLNEHFGNAAASTAVFAFLAPKFKTDGVKYWSGRLAKEMEKSRTHSEKQSDRAKKRWSEQTEQPAANATASATAMPVMELEMELKVVKDKEVKEEKELQFPYTSIAFLAAWADWMNYKKLRRESIKMPQSVLKQMAKYPEVSVIESIERAIANGWQGWDQNQNNKTSAHGNTRGKTQNGNGIGGDPSTIARTGFGGKL